MKWNSTLYDSKHNFVSKYGQEVVELLNPIQGETILDLGCGTGDLAELIATSGATVVGIDSSEEMIISAQKKYPNIVFKVQKAENFNFEASFDAVFSNAVLHWVLEKEKAIDSVYRSLKPLGRFVAEFGGKGNVNSIVIALRESLNKFGFTENAKTTVWYFPSIAEYATLLEKRGFRITFATHFDRETELNDLNGIKNWLKMFAQSFLNGLTSEQTDLVLNEAENQMKKDNFINGKWYADYKRLRIVAIKE